MFDVGFIVLRKVVLYIWREIEGGSWAGVKGEAEEVICVYSRHSRRKGCRRSY